MKKRNGCTNACEAFTEKNSFFFDKENLRTSTHWAQELEQGVINCDAVIAIIGSYWCDSSAGGGADRLHDENDWVRQELELAFNHDKPIFPVRLDNVALPSKRFLPDSLKRMHDIQSLKVDTKHFGREIKQLLEDLAEQGFPPKQATTKQATSNSKYLNTSKTRFTLTEEQVIGRAKELKRLTQQLQNSNELVLISGLGGIGKTTLATYYLSQHQSDYDHIGWISCTGDFKNDVLLSLNALPKSESTDLEVQFREHLQTLQGLKGNNILVIDNINTQSEAEEVLQYKDAFPSHFKLLMTARVNLQGFPTHQIGVLDKADAQDLFKKHYDFRAGDTDDQLTELLQHIGRHTLVIEMLAKGMEASGRLNLARMLQRIAAQGIQSIKVAASTERSQHQSRPLNEFVAFVFELSLQDIAAENWILLQQLALLPPLAHEFDLVAYLLGRDEANQQDDLDGQLSTLQRKGLIDYEKEQISLHPVLREVINEKGDKELDTFKQILIKIKDLLYIDSETKDIIQKFEFIPYGESALNVLEYLESKEIADLQHWLAWVYNQSGNYNRAEALLIKAVAISENVLESNHPDIGRNYSTLGIVYGYLGKYKQAAQLLENALQSDLKNFGKDHPEVAVKQSNLALAYQNLGRYEQAAQLLENALQSDLKNFGKDHPSVARSQSNLAIVYRKLGRYEQAAQLLENALQSDLKNFGNHHPTVAIRQSNLANVYGDLGRYEQAAQLLENALQSDLKNFGNHHPTVAIRQSNLANVYGDLGRYEQAAQLLENALQSDLKNFGNHHPTVAIRQSNLAIVYKDLGRYEQAAQLLENALQSDLKNFGNHHPSVARSQSNLANVYGDLGRYEQAAQLLENALQSDLKNFGKDHPSVARSQSNLANVYGDLGRYEQAAQLLENALQSDLKNFGKDHPNVAFRLNNLAFVEQATKAYQAAAEHFVQAYQIFLNHLGAEHPNTKTVLNSLVSCLQEGAVAGDEYCQEMLARME